ncbi:PadR family transcriptional regulator [Brachybacterium sp. 107]|uniref:PadR family transcriptional regulator n=1 Tax=Brachybacterium sp. 107 TaxID=3457736 RepID=UPI004033D942
MDDLDPRPDGVPQWPATWIRALLPSAVLACLELTALHGYGIAQALHARGFGTPKGGSLYPVLARLEDTGAITAEWVPGPSGPARRQYTLTAAGRTRLVRDRTSLTLLGHALGTSAEGIGSAPEIEGAAPRPTPEGGPNDT